MPPKSRRPFRLERLEDRVTPAGNILVSALTSPHGDKLLREYTPSGALVRTIPVPTPIDPRDIIVAANGDIDVYNGTFNPVLVSTLSAATGTWSSQTTANWNTANNITYGGIASWGNYVFVTDMQINGDSGECKGLVRFNLADGTVDRYDTGSDLIQLTMGLDGKLYTLQYPTGLGSPVKKYDPATMQQIGSANLNLPDPRGLAVAANGDMYVANWDRTICHTDPNGIVLQTITLTGPGLGIFSASDINISTDGQLVVGTRSGNIVLTDTNLSNVTYLTVGGQADNYLFVAFADPQFPPSPPSLGGIESGPLGYNAGHPAAAITDSVSLTEQGANTISGATVRITSGFAPGDDWLHFTPEFGITGVYNSDTGVLTLNGSASVLAYQEALRDVTYADTNLNPTDATRTVTLQVTGGTAEHFSSNIVSRDVHVTPHVGPSLTNIESSTLVVAEGDAATPVTASLTLTDPDSATLCAATVSIGAGYMPGEDLLQYTDQFGIDGDFYPTTGVISLYGAATLAEWQTALQSITYRNTSANPSAATRTITFQVDDNFAFNHASNAVSRDVTIAPVNTPPALTVPIAGPHGSQGSDIVVSGISAADPDAQGATEDLTLSVSHGTIKFVDLTGLTIDGGANNSASVTVGGTLAALNAALAGANVVYHPDAAFVGTETLSLVLNDNGNTGSGGAQGSSKSIPITVAPHAPPTLSGIELAPLSFGEGADDTTVTSSLVITPGDRATIAGAIVSISAGFAANEDVLGFKDQNGITGSYDPAAGVLTLSGTASVADYQAALRSLTYRDTSLDPSTANRTISFAVDDGAAFNHFSNTQSRTATVIAINTPPSLTVPGNGPSGVRDTDMVVSGISVADVDAEGASESLTLSATHGRLRFLSLTGISITGGLNNSSTVTVTGPIANLNAALAGGNLVYHSFVGYHGTDSLNLSLSDNGHSGFGLAQFASASIGITLNPVAPVLGGIETSALAFTEGGAAKPITAALKLSSADSTAIIGATVAITGGFTAGEDVLGFVNQPMIKGSYDAATGVLTLTGTATVGQYQMALRSVTYRNTSHDPSTSSRTITFQVDDGLASNNLSNTVSRTVTVAAVNTAPTVTVPATRPSGPSSNDFALNGISVADVDAEGAAETLALSVAHGSIQFADLTGLSVVGGANGSATMTVQGTLPALNGALGGGNLIYHSTFSFAGNDTLKLVLNDGGNSGNGGAKSAMKSLSFGVAHVAPVLSSIESSDVTYTEGDPATPLTSDLALGSIDRLTLAGATVRITSAFQPGQDVLAFTKQNGIIGTYYALAGVLTLSGVSSLANYEAALYSVTYRNTSQNPSTAPRAITFQVRDGSPANGSSNVLSRTLSLIAVNNAPTLTVPMTSPKVKHDVDLHLGGIILADVDAKGGLEDLMLTVGRGRVRFVNLHGLTVKAGANDSATITVEGTLPQLLGALANGNLVYHSDALFSGADTLDLDFDDNGSTGIGGPLFTFKSFAINVT